MRAVLLTFTTCVALHAGIDTDADTDLDEALDGLRAAEQTLADRRKQAGTDPSIHMKVMSKIDSQDHFARSKEPRDRSPDVEFRVGEVVRHTVWKYKAVVVGWDPFAKVPESWVQRNSWSGYNASKDPGALGTDTYWRLMPNYALLVDSRDRPGATSTTYVPQTNLEAMRGVKIMNKLLTHYFLRYESSCGQYIPTRALALIYPNDVSDDCALDTHNDAKTEWVSWTSDPAYSEIIEGLLASGAEVAALEDSGSRPSHWAAKAGHVELLLRAMRVSRDEALALDARGMNAAGLAAQAGHVDILSSLVANRVQVDDPIQLGPKLLPVAAAEGHTEITSWLLQRRADVSASEAGGIQAIHRASKHGHEAIVDILIAHGVAVQAQDEAGVQPLHIAVERGHDRIVETMILHKANPDASDNSGVRGLFWAAARGHLTIGRQLIDARAKVNPLEESLTSEPLYWASEYGHVDLVNLLVGARASVHAETKYGSALSGAIQNGHWHVVQSLLDLRAEASAESSLDQAKIAKLRPTSHDGRSDL